MPGRWKLFRVLCLVQILLAGPKAGYAIFLILFYPGFYTFRIADAICLIAMALFGGLGLSLINHNYPDIRPEGRQKRYFNFLYLINFILTAYIGGHVFVEMRSIVFFMSLNVDYFSSIWWFILPSLLWIVMLLLHIYLLFMMFRLRRELYVNYLNMIDNSFGEKAG